MSIITDIFQPWQLQNIGVAALRVLARKSFPDFVKAMMTDYIMNWHHMEIAEWLQQFYQDVIDEKAPRGMIVAPPQTGKSLLVSNLFPAWIFGRNPDFHLIGTSYNSTFAALNNTGIQKYMDSAEYASMFPGTRLPDRGKKSRNYSRTSSTFQILGHKGQYHSAGILAGVTGFAANMVIIDDAIKNDKAASSLLFRESLWNEYTRSIRTRVRKSGGILVVNTRWHDDDLSGRLLKIAEKEPLADQWDLLHYEALATKAREHQAVGQTLFPAQFSTQDYIRTRASIPARDWECLYQGTPPADMGSIFKSSWFKRYKRSDLPLVFDRMCMSMDTSFKDLATSDYTVAGIWGLKGANAYLLDVVRGQWDFVKARSEVGKLYQKWPYVNAKLIEDKANGTAIISSLKNVVPGLIAVNPKESKIARAYSISPLVNAGNIFIPESNMFPWVDPYVFEMAAFPNGKNDDQVDMTSQALLWLYGTKLMTITKAVLAKFDAAAMADAENGILGF